MCSICFSSLLGGAYHLWSSAWGFFFCRLFFICNKGKCHEQNATLSYVMLVDALCSNVHKLGCFCQSFHLSIPHSSKFFFSSCSSSTSALCTTFFLQAIPADAVLGGKELVLKAFLCLINGSSLLSHLKYELRPCCQTSKFYHPNLSLSLCVGIFALKMFLLSLNTATEQRSSSRWLWTSLVWL